MSGVSIQRVRKRYGDTEVIPELSVDIHEGEFLVFVGPSGCGKSTLLRMVAGLEGFEAGDIHIGGVRVNTMHPSERDIAMVFQDYALYPHMTVRQNMGFGLRMRGTPADEIAKRIQDAAEILQIAHLLERRPRALSGGQRQRVAMGRAIVRKLPAVETLGATSVTFEQFSGAGQINAGAGLVKSGNTIDVVGTGGDDACHLLAVHLGGDADDLLVADSQDRAPGIGDEQPAKRHHADQVAVEAMRQEMERCARMGTPRPESSAVRAHVPGAFWSFANSWRDIFHTGVCDHAVIEHVCDSAADGAQGKHGPGD